MLKAAIDKILSLAEPTIVKVADESYSNQDLYRMKKDLVAAPIQVRTLTAVADYITCGMDESQADIENRFVIHVASQDQVYLYHELNRDKARECLLEAELDCPVFPFGKWMDMETFIIHLQTYFLASINRDKLIQMASTVTSENGVSLADDGMTQKVTVRGGISLVKNMDVPNPITLCPYRTFQEIEQPESPFVFRVRMMGDAVEAALFSCDGGAWKMIAMEGIKEWFENNLPEKSLAEDVIILA